MPDNIMNISLITVKKDIYRGIVESRKRGLLHCAKWLTELNHGLDPGTLAENAKDIDSSQIDIVACSSPSEGISDEEWDDYNLAKSYFDLREYDRSAHFTKNCESAVPKFLHLYATYMAKAKKRLDNMTDSAYLTESANVKDFATLMSTLKAQYTHERKMDAYTLYLYGVVLKKLDLNDLAIQIFLESINKEPTLWSSWLELAPLITDREKLSTLKLPNHWMKHIFMGHTLIELFLNDEGLKVFEDLQNAGFKRCVYVTSQTAIAHHNKRNVDKAISVFKELQKVDPFRLDNLDILSNLLFVKELKAEMAFLAHRAVEIDKYRPETCCVIGNYYSIRSDHQKAVIYFQRALKLNPQYLSAWTLMGHEFMEMKNTNAAIQSYRKAVEVNRRDYRAWYGLGQSYEILKMPMYSLYYYKIAQQFRPYDSRMLVALGETYEKLDKNANALKCFQKACNVGDIEGIALLRLADLYKKMNDIESAVPAYLSYCSDERAAVDKTSLCRAFITLGNYYESVGNFEQAQHFAYRCLEYDDTKSEARSLLKTIENSRVIRHIKSMESNRSRLVLPPPHPNPLLPTTAAVATTAASSANTTTTPSSYFLTPAPVSADCSEMSMDDSDSILQQPIISTMLVDDETESSIDEE